MLDRLCILASLLHFLDRRRSCRVSTGSRVLAGEFFAGTHVGYTPPHRCLAGSRHRCPLLYWS